MGKKVEINSTFTSVQNLNLRNFYFKTYRTLRVWLEKVIKVFDTGTALSLKNGNPVYENSVIRLSPSRGDNDFITTSLVRELSPSLVPVRNATCELIGGSEGFEKMW